MVSRLAAAAGFLLSIALAVPATAQVVMPTRPVINAPIARIATARRTAFDPAVHGFKFVNSFAVDLVPQLDVRTDGLCGGMVYAALDYFNARQPIPTQDYQPTEGTPLHTFLFRRQVDSVTSNVDKWAEVSVNPFGTRNSEFYRWGLEMTPGSRIEELRREIDAGRPVPLGLRSCDEGCSADHQVLAIGYDLANYTGDFGVGLRQVKIFVYDPNFPGRTMTLMAFPEAEQFRYLEANSRGHRHRWRTWFVNLNYRPAPPPAVTQAPNELVLDLLTGGDDLRGGGDNLDVVLLLKDGRELPFAVVNNRRRWVNNSWHAVSLPLPADVSVEHIRGVRLSTSFRGGFDGDNWNLDRIKAMVRGPDRSGTIFDRSGGPLFRFTGDQRVQEFIFE